MLGKYELLDVLGSGGTAVAYLARTAGAGGFQKLVVVKRLLPEVAADPEFTGPFLDEARIASAFSHANIISAFDFGGEHGDYYLAMDFVQGKTLRGILQELSRRGKRLPGPAALHIAAETCRGLAYAHALKDQDGHRLNVVHRDISPHNVMIAWSGDVRILDFGIATFASRSFRTQVGMVKGKFRYMAPEQAAGLPLDGRADLYAVGVLLWEMLLGRRAVPEGSDADLLTWVASAEFEGHTEAGLPPELKAILLKAIEADPDRRWPGCAELGQALTRYNAVHHPEFTPGELVAFLEGEFEAEIDQGRIRIAALLAGKAPSAEELEEQTSTARSAKTPGGDTVVTPHLPARPAAGEGTFSANVPALLPGLVVADSAGKPAVTSPTPPSRPPPWPWVIVGSAVVAAVVGALAVSLLPPAPIMTPSPSPGTATPAISLPQTSPRPAIRLPPVAVASEASPVPRASSTVRAHVALVMPVASSTSTPAPPLPAGKGRLSLNAYPWARVTVDGEEWGITPKERELPSGKHSISFENDTQGFTQQIEVDVRPDQTLSYKACVAAGKVVPGVKVEGRITFACPS